MTGAAAAAVSAGPPVLGVIVPDFRNGHAHSTPITTGNATAIVSGGTAPYTYVWTAAGGSGTWTINSPTSQTTSFTCTDTESLDIASQDFYCTVHDSAAGVATSNLLTANVTATG